jgi:hypothetical protein
MTVMEETVDEDPYSKQDEEGSANIRPEKNWCPDDNDAEDDKKYSEER